MAINKRTHRVNEKETKKFFLCISVCGGGGGRDICTTSFFVGPIKGECYH